MFRELFPMAAKGGFHLHLMADEGSGLMTVVVVPKSTDTGKDVPALAMPLKLTATPDELDDGFVQALTSFAAQRISLDEQVAATNEVLEAAKAASVKKGADAMTKAGAKAGPHAAAKQAAAGGDDDAHGDEAGGGEDDAPQAPGAEPKEAAPAAGVSAPDLFGT